MNNLSVASLAEKKTHTPGAFPEKPLYIFSKPGPPHTSENSKGLVLVHSYTEIIMNKKHLDRRA